MDGDDATRPSAPRDLEALSDADLLALAREGAEELDQTSWDHLASLWDGIAAAAFGDDAQDRPSPPNLVAVAPDADPDADPHAGPDTGRARRARTPSMVRSVEARQRRTVAGALAGIAAVLLAVVGVSWVVTREPAPAPVATFRMDPLDDRAPSPVSGSIVAADAGQAVDVDLDSLPPPPGGSFYELWLLDLDQGRLVSLGPVGPDGTFTVPIAVADGTWPTIDVSIEPADGDPAHSGDSVLRGPVTAAPAT